MRIAIVVSPCLPINPDGYGGLERVAGMLADELARRHDVVVYGAKGSKTERAKLVEVIEPEFTGAIGEIKQLKLIEQELKEYDVVDFHYHFPPPFGIWSVHDLLPPMPYKCLRIIARSIFHAKFLEAKWGWNVDFCYNPIDIREWIPSYHKEDFILFFSRITKGKGAITFAKWCRELKIKGIIAGTDDISKGVNPYELIEFYKSLSSYTEFIGEVTHKQIANIMPHAKALVLPYDTRYFIPVFDLVIVEALACGTPVLTVKTGATVELLGSGKTKIGYTADSIEELRRAVSKIDKLKFDYRACRKRAEMFDVKRIAKVYEKMLLS